MTKRGMLERRGPRHRISTDTKFTSFYQALKRCTRKYFVCIYACAVLFFVATEFSVNKHLYKSI